MNDTLLDVLNVLTFCTDLKKKQMKTVGSTIMSQGSRSARNTASGSSRDGGCDTIAKSVLTMLQDNSTEDSMVVQPWYIYYVKDCL